MTSVKMCTKCKQEKSLDDFVKRKATKDGRGSWCKSCHNSYRRETGWNNYNLRPEYHKLHQRKLRQTDEYRIKSRKYKRKYHSTFEGTVTTLYRSAKLRARKKSLEITIERQWIIKHLTLMKCEATGVDLTLIKSKKVEHSPFRPSIDRIDNSKGYTKENCRIVCVIYNKAKSDCTDEDVLKMAKALVTRRDKDGTFH